MFSNALDSVITRYLAKQGSVPSDQAPYYYICSNMHRHKRNSVPFLNRRCAQCSTANAVASKVMACTNPAPTAMAGKKESSSSVGFCSAENRRALADACGRKTTLRGKGRGRVSVRYAARLSTSSFRARQLEKP